MNLILLADFGAFLGRFHPLLVHLPIGFLLLAVLFEWWDRKKEAPSPNPLIPFSWLLGALSAVAAATCGWLLAADGNYPEGTLFWHRWLGIGVAVLATAGWWIKRTPAKVPARAPMAINIGIVSFLMIGGHLGGNLTHGSDYLLEKAPVFVQKIFGGKGEVLAELPRLSHPDSSLLYANLVHPILERKCLSCHNNDVQRGGLNMDSTHLLQKGGENGAVIAAGNALESELFQRVTLSPKSAKFMPPKGDALTYDEIRVLEWWLNEQATFEKKVSDVDVPAGIKPVLMKLYGLDTSPKPWYETASAPPLVEAGLAQIGKAGFKVNTLAGTNPLLEVTFPESGPVGAERLQSLLVAKEQLTWLYLGGKEIQDADLNTLAQFPNLTRLRLENNPVTDAGIAHLEGLPHLESLNLYGTKITDEALKSIVKIPTLRHLYLWQTGVSEAAVADLQKSRPDLEVDLGIRIAEK